MKPAVLTVNAGSSSVRFAAFAPEGESLSRRASGHFPGEWTDPAAMLRAFLKGHGIGAVAAVAHRIVHGGARLTAPCRIDAAVEAEIERLVPLAPLHNPRALEWIRACRALLGAETTQVAVFDTAFYGSLPEVAATYALPRALCAHHGVRRYGFHGIAHQAMWRRWCELAPDLATGGRVISLQLGAGCSITAVRDGQVVDTSMGFSPLEGLVMATRPGDVDPGLLLFLQRAERLTPERMERLLNEEAGLLGLSGASGDMGALLRLSRLLEDPGLRAAIGNDPSATCHPDAMRPGELVDFARRHGFDAGPDWPEIRDWFERFPDQTLLMRRIEGHAVMVSSFVPVSQLASTGAVSESLLEAAKETDADPDRSFLGVVMFADVAPSDIADAARLGAGAFMLQRGVGGMQSMLIHYPSPDRRPTVQTAIATEVDGDLARGVAISDFRPDGAIGTVEAMVLGEHGLTRSSSGRAELLVQDDDVHRIARLREVLDEVFDDSDTDRRLRETIELVHLGGRRSEQECLEAMHVSRRTWFRLLRTARERVAAG